MRAGRLVAIICGALLTALGLGAAAVGGGLVLAHATQRDSDGYYRSATEPLRTPTAALVAEVNFAGGATDTDWIPDNPAGTFRVDARAPGYDALFIGIAASASVRTWLDGASYERVSRVGPGPWDTTTERVTGPRALTRPDTQTFWVSSTAGQGRQTLTWNSEPGEWTMVIANVDAHPGVAADVTVGARTGILLPVGVGLSAAGLLILSLGIVVMLGAIGRNPTEPSAAPATVAGTYPVRLDATLDPGLSRWLWLVKWLLAIPHSIVLAFLWLAFVPLTSSPASPSSSPAGTPGQSSTSTSVWCGGPGGLRTTRSMPSVRTGTRRSRLRPDPTYPADLAVDYPERLSRGLVLVKWWLLAIPHYMVVAFFAGNWSWRRTRAGANIAVRRPAAASSASWCWSRRWCCCSPGRYPRPLFDFVMGMNRWCYRVLAYAALMRDEYPPFRLDTGGPDPGSVPVTPPPPDAPAPAMTEPREFAGTAR